MREARADCGRSSVWGDTIFASHSLPIVRATLLVGLLIAAPGCTQRYIEGTDIPIAYWHEEITECRDGSPLDKDEIESQYSGLRWLNVRGEVIPEPFEIGITNKGTCVYFPESESERANYFYQYKSIERGWELVFGLANVIRQRKGSKCLTWFAADVDWLRRNYTWNIEYEDMSGTKRNKKFALITGDYPLDHIVYLVWVEDIQQPEDCTS